MNKILIIGGFLGICGLVIIFIMINRSAQPIVSEPVLNSPSPVTSTQTDYTASFEVYTNGTKRIFTDSKYHNKSPDVYISSLDPSIIYVRKAGVTWDDFFKTLPMKLTDDCLTTGTGQVFCSGERGTLNFYINDIRIDNALTRTISPNEKLTVRFGSSNP